MGCFNINLYDVVSILVRYTSKLIPNQFHFGDFIFKWAYELIKMHYFSLRNHKIICQFSNMRNENLALPRKYFDTL